MRLLVLGEYNPAWETHRATDAAIAETRTALNLVLDTSWCSTESVTPELLAQSDGFWIATGTPYKSMARALDVIRHARERGVPCLATCQGFQHLMLEYARSFLGIENPAHAEYDPAAPKPFISALACSLRGQEGEVQLAAGSRAAQIYGSARTVERFYCSYGIAPEFVPHIRKSDAICVSGTDANGDIRIVEYRDHPFMIGTLFVPQARSQPGRPHLLVSEFLRAIKEGERRRR
jgi:CTP synthase (UTP-ammonia lyase)